MNSAKMTPDQIYYEMQSKTQCRYLLGVYSTVNTSRDSKILPLPKISLLPSTALISKTVMQLAGEMHTGEVFEGLHLTR